MSASGPLRSSTQLRAIVDAREPTLWRQSFVHDWAALRTWTEETLAEAVPWMVARSSPHAEFVLTAPQRGQKAHFLRHQRDAELAHVTRNATVAEVLAASSAAVADGGHEYLYYSGTIGDAPTAHWQTERLLNDVQPLTPLHIFDMPSVPPGAALRPPEGVAVPPNRTVMRLWLSGAKVLSRTHYDKAHNLFAQISGTKHVLLWPPEQLPSLHLYPATHAAFRQSQLPLDPPAGAEAAAHGAPPLPSYGAGAVRATLGPGDLLYIPPYTAHAVLSEGPCVSLAAFSDSWEQARWARSAWLRAPLGSLLHTPCRRARGAAGLIMGFAQALAQSPSPALAAAAAEPARRLVASLLASRYAPLYGDAASAPGDDAASGGAAAACAMPDAPPGGDGASATRTPAPLGAAELETCLAAPADVLVTTDEQLRARLRAHAAEVAALLTDPDEEWRGRVYSAGVAAELAADYVEELAGWACGADGVWLLLRLLATRDAAELPGAAFGGYGFPWYWYV